jgi:membrane protease YdiL (CAAX protease family)
MKHALSLADLIASWPTVVLLLTATLAYAAHHHLGLDYFRARLSGSARSSQERAVRAVLCQRGGGFLLLGVIPGGVALFVLELPASQLGLTWNQLPLSIAGGLAIALAVIVSGPTAIARCPGLLRYYPEMRDVTWSARLDLLNAFSWTVYLSAYELLFRGLLLFPLASALGAWVALLISSALYTFAHLPKHPLESATVVPGGFLLGALALHTGSVVGQIIAHTLLAAGFELIAARRSSPSSIAAELLARPQR